MAKTPRGVWIVMTIGLAVAGGLAATYGFWWTPRQEKLAERSAVEEWGVHWQKLQSCLIGPDPLSTELDLAFLIAQARSEQDSIAQCTALVKALPARPDHEISEKVRTRWAGIDEAKQKLAYAQGMRGSPGFSLADMDAQAKMNVAVADALLVVADAYDELAKSVGIAVTRRKTANVPVVTFAGSSRGVCNDMENRPTLVMSETKESTGTTLTSLVNSTSASRGVPSGVGVMASASDPTVGAWSGENGDALRWITLDKVGDPGGEEGLPLILPSANPVQVIAAAGTRQNGFVAFTYVDPTQPLAAKVSQLLVIREGKVATTDSIIGYDFNLVTGTLFAHTGAAAILQKPDGSRITFPQDFSSSDYEREQTQVAANTAWELAGRRLAHFGDKFSSTSVEPGSEILAVTDRHALLSGQSGFSLCDAVAMQCAPLKIGPVASSVDFFDAAFDGDSVYLLGRADGLAMVWRIFMQSKTAELFAAVRQRDDDRIRAVLPWREGLFLLRSKEGAWGVEPVRELVKPDSAPLPPVNSKAVSGESVP